MMDYDKKYLKKELWNMDPVDVYKIVLYGKYNKKFPDNYWDRPDCLVLCKQIVRFLVEEKLKWSSKQIKECLSMKTFQDNSLRGMLLTVFNGSPYAAIENAYPGRFYPWEFSKCRIWDKDTAKRATVWLIEEQLKWSDDDIKNNLIGEVFQRNGLGGMFKSVFNDSTYAAIENAYPGRFHPWEFSCCTLGFWNEDTAREATLWLMEEQLKWSDDEIRNGLSVKTFYDNGLRGMLNIVFKGSPFKAIDGIYPGKFKPWELSKCGNRYWNENSAKDATIWMVDEKLKWSEEDIKNNLTQKVFYDNGLGGMLSNVFNSSPYAAIDNAYPGKFKKTDFKGYK